MLDTKHINSYINRMNKLPINTRAQILTLLCEGVSMRSITRIADVSINTVSKLLVDTGKFCADLHDREVRNVKAQHVQCDEIWSFTAAKQKNVAAMKKPVEGAGDTWTWTALDRDSKLIISWLVGGRDGEYALAFMDDVKHRLANRVQLTTDGHRAYLEAVEAAFGDDVDYAQIVKIYGNVPEAAKGRYSPAECTGARKVKISGDPKKSEVSTSHVERQNLTMRMQMRRFTRLTNGFSKKFENHMHMVALYTVWYNFIRIHKTLKMSPAMAAGISKTLWSMTELCEKMDLVAPKPGRRGPYKKLAEEISN
jgi:IS1 family transposase